MKLDDLYDALEQAPLLKADVDIFHGGSIVKIDEARETKHGPVPALTLRLDAPTDDGDEFGVLLLGSAQLCRELAKAARRAGRREITLGHWVSAGVVEKRETANGNTMNIWEVGYKASSPADDDGSIGRGVLAGDDDPVF